MRCWKNTSLLQQLRQQARCCLPIVVQKTPSLNLRQICRQLLVLCYVLAAQLLLPSALAQESRGAEIRQLQVRQAKEGLLLNASIAFKLGPALQDALVKGVPLHFVAQADVQRDR